MNIPLVEITPEQVIGLNKVAIKYAHQRDPKCKQQHGVIDRNKLDARIAAIFQQLHPAGYMHLPLEKMAGLLLYRIAEGQIFRDGNKRTALLTMVTFLHNNGHKIRIERTVVNDLMWGFAPPMSGGPAKYKEDDAVQFVFDNIIPNIQSP